MHVGSLAREAALVQKTQEAASSDEDNDEVTQQKAAQVRNHAQHHFVLQCSLSNVCLAVGAARACFTPKVQHCLC